MVLDEILRNQIDTVLRRQRVADYLAAFLRGLFAALITFAIVRALFGTLTGGQGGLLALLLALAAGITFVITTPRQQHNRLTAARYIDKQLQLKDRLATAVEYATLDHAARNRVEEWLFLDAANHTHLIDPITLVPLKAPAYVRWFLPLFGLCILLTLIPYPQGFTWQLGASQLSQIAKRADELTALADQFERIDPQNTYLSQLADELRRVSELIRDNQLPRDQANQLLRQLEQELQQGSSNIAGTSLGIDLDRVQELTQNIRNIESGMYSQLSPQEQAALSQAQRSTRGAGSNIGANPSSRGAPQNPEDNAATAGGSDENESDGGSSSGQGQRQSGTSSQGGSDMAGLGEDESDPFGGSGLGSGEYGDDDEMGYGLEGGLMAGAERGNQGTTNYERQTNLNQGPERLTGQISDSGQYYVSATSSTSLPGSEQRFPTTGGSRFSLPGGVENAIQQENIPLAYQRWIRDYFTKLDPGTNR
jgi:hypothetical protein